MSASPPVSPAGAVPPVNISSTNPSNPQPPAAKVALEVVPLTQVVDEELERIQERRNHAGFRNDARPPDPVRDNLVGLALSGGGIRSASFNLGVLQALYRSGFLRFVDYLSTVSGGGYIGAFFSTRVRTLGDKPLYETSQSTANSSPAAGATPSSGNPNPNPAPNLLRSGPAQGGVSVGLSASDDGKPAPAVQSLLRNGRYLNYPGLFLNRYLFGLALNNIAIFSLLVAACVLVAYAWRSMDFLEARWMIKDALTAVGAWIGAVTPVNATGLQLLGDDIGVCFLPAFLAFAAWILCWCIGLALQNKRRIREQGATFNWTKNLLLLTMAFALIGFAVLLGNGNITAGTEEPLEAVPNRVVVVLGVLGLIGLLPVLRPWRLIGSGQRPRSQLETYLFTIACTSLLVGVPLFVIYWVAKENVSGYATYSVDDIADWRKFAERLKAEKDSWPAKPIWDELAKPAYQVSDMKDVIEIKEEREGRGVKLPIVSLRDFLQEGAPRKCKDGKIEDENDLSPVFGILQQTKYPHVLRRRHLLLRAVNEVLSDREFPKGYKPGIKMDRDTAQFLAKLQGLFFADASKNPLSEKQAAKLSDLHGKYLFLYDYQKSKHTEFKDEFAKEDFRRELGQLLLAQHFAGLVPAEKRAVRRAVVIDRDQSTRLRWLMIALIVFGVAMFLVNLNSTSLHGFYRDQLAATYLAKRKEGREISLRNLRFNTTKGAPYHLLSATLMQYPSIWETISGKGRATPNDETKQDPCRAGTVEAFLFSPLYCGSASTGYQESKKFRVNGRRVQVADAMAISGAAVTPLQVRNALVRVLMMILNIRLGQWLPNPGKLKTWLKRPSILNVLLTVFRNPADRSICFVTDGGHYENLGIWALLERRCRLIVAADASQDNEHAFEDFLHLCRRARLDAGISLVELQRDADGLDVPLLLHGLRLHPDGPGTDAEALRSLKERFSQNHYLIARIKYPPGTTPAEGLLVYMKASLTGDEESDLVGYCKENEAFPHDPTSDTMFDEKQVESYRQLGFHIADGMCRDLDKAVAGHVATMLPAGATAATIGKRLWHFDEFAIDRILELWLETTSKQPGKLAARRKNVMQRIATSLATLSGQVESFQAARAAADGQQQRVLAEIAESLNRFNDLAEQVTTQATGTAEEQKKLANLITEALQRLNSAVEQFQVQSKEADAAHNEVIRSAVASLLKPLEALKSGAGATTGRSERSSLGLYLSKEQLTALQQYLHSLKEALQRGPANGDKELIEDKIEMCLKVCEFAETKAAKPSRGKSGSRRPNRT